MLIVLIVASIFLLIIGLLMDASEVKEVLCIVGGLGLAIFGVITLCITMEYVGTRTVDAKIAMYQEENKAIEEKIEATVKQYMSFEKDTYKDLKVDSYINLVSLYPELKSDTLIKEQINTYQENSETIIGLKESKIDRQALKWWLFFGK